MRPYVMDQEDGGSVKRMAGARLAGLKAMGGAMGDALESRARAGAGQSAAVFQRVAKNKAPRGYASGGGVPRMESGPDYASIGAQIGKGIAGLFGSTGGGSTEGAGGGSFLGSLFR